MSPLEASFGTWEVEVFWEASLRALHWGQSLIPEMFLHRRHLISSNGLFSLVLCRFLFFLGRFQYGERHLAQVPGLGEPRGTQRQLQRRHWRMVSIMRKGIQSTYSYCNWEISG